jgi:hypothetical protein
MAQEQRRIIDAQLDESAEAVRAGSAHEPFSNIGDPGAFLARCGQGFRRKALHCEVVNQKFGPGPDQEFHAKAQSALKVFIYNVLRLCSFA